MSAAPNIQSNAALDALLSKVDELAVLPHVVFQVLEISGSGDYPGQELERAVIVDPGFSGRILTLANSAYYGLPRKVASIREAISFLGFKAIRQMAMTVGVFDLFVGKNDADSLRRRAWWRHSIDSAVCCKLLARPGAGMSPEDAYTAGLLHWIGKCVLDRHGEAKYGLVEQLLERGADARQAEQAVFGCDHEAVGAGVAGKWGFPENLVGAMEYLTVPEPGYAHAALRGAVVISDLIAQYAVEGGPEDGSVERTLPAWALGAIGRPVESTMEIIESGIEAISLAGSLQL
jgi:HD-like signal output (HDOD) protein